MRCEYGDGLKVDYAGSLHIKKGNEIDVYMKDGFIPANIKTDLERATQANSCDDMRRVAKSVTDTVGNRACIHE